MHVLLIPSPGQCALLGSNKCTYGPSYWCSHIHHAKECNTMQHCIDTAWKDQSMGMIGSVSVHVCVYACVHVCVCGRREGGERQKDRDRRKVRTREMNIQPLSKNEKYCDIFGLTRQEESETERNEYTAFV